MVLCRPARLHFNQRGPFLSAQMEGKVLHLRRSHLELFDRLGCSEEDPRASLSDLSGEEREGIEVLRRLVFEHRLPPVASPLFEDMLVNTGLSFVPLDGKFRHASDPTSFFYLF